MKEDSLFKVKHRIIAQNRVTVMFLDIVLVLL